MHAIAGCSTCAAMVVQQRLPAPTSVLSRTPTHLQQICCYTLQGKIWPSHGCQYSAISNTRGSHCWSMHFAGPKQLRILSTSMFGYTRARHVLHWNIHIYDTDNVIVSGPQISKVRQDSPSLHGISPNVHLQRTYTCRGAGQQSLTITLQVDCS